MNLEVARYVMRLLPARKRADVQAIAEGCVLIRQSAMSPECCSGGAGVQRLPVMLEDVLRRHAVPMEAARGFVEACIADAATTRYATWNALKRHCEGVGGNAALMMAGVLGVTHSDAASRAISLGAAMRLTGILREMSKELAAGRVYLPIEELTRQRLSERVLLARRIDERRAAAVVRAGVERARELLKVGGEGLTWVVPDGSRAAAGLCVALTAATLDEIASEGATVLRKPPKVRALRVLRRAGDAWRMARRGTGASPVDL